MCERAQLRQRTNEEAAAAEATSLDELTTVLRTSHLDVPGE
jgi:hypothetical protein